MYFCSLEIKKCPKQRYLEYQPEYGTLCWPDKTINGCLLEGLIGGKKKSSLDISLPTFDNFHINIWIVSRYQERHNQFKAFDFSQNIIAIYLKVWT
jgi:hypothetical protein